MLRNKNMPIQMSNYESYQIFIFLDIYIGI